MYFYNLWQRFEEVVKRNSNEIAVRTSNQDHTYESLFNSVHNYALLLRNSKLEKGDVLCIVNTKQFESYAMMLACLKIGVTYVNLDADNPIERTEKIIVRCKPKGIFEDLSNNRFKNLCEKYDLLHLNTDSVQGLVTTAKDKLNEEVDGNTIAYIMFTSGSTGEPKGVAITHQNLLHFSDWIRLRYEITSKDNFANLSPMYFDNSVFDFYGSLFNGASITPVYKELTESPKDLVHYVNKMKCTIWFSVPSLLIFLMNMKVLRKGVFQHIRIFTFGGEGFPKSNLKKLVDLYGETSKIINVYGPTEGTCICTTHTITNDDFYDMSELPSLGTMNPNFSYLIDGLNEQNEGELVIIGPNVAAGYFNDPERSEKVFGVFQSGKYYLNRYYRTGDIVKEVDGLLYFKGRKDNQIKHMGYRIELEEIENAINTISSIKESAVVYKRINDSYGKILAYVVTESQNDVKEIKAHLQNKIPNYMIPSKIEFISVLPKNANGKIDRKKLKDL